MPVVVVVMMVPVVPVVMTVPITTRNHDHSAPRTAVPTAPVGWNVMRDARNAVHVLNHRQILDCTRDAGRGTDPGRFGTMGERA